MSSAQSIFENPLSSSTSSAHSHIDPALLGHDEDNTSRHILKAFNERSDAAIFIYSDPQDRGREEECLLSLVRPLYTCEAPYIHVSNPASTPVADKRIRINFFLGDLNHLVTEIRIVTLDVLQDEMIGSVLIPLAYDANNRAGTRIPYPRLRLHCKETGLEVPEHLSWRDRGIESGSLQSLWGWAHGPVDDPGECY